MTQIVKNAIITEVEKYGKILALRVYFPCVRTDGGKGMNSKKILVIGSANADLVIGCARMPRLGETIVGEGFSVGAGGKGLNQAVAAKKLGGEVSFVCSLGRDSNADMLRARLDSYGVSFKGVYCDTLNTGCAMITVVGGDNFIILDEGANKALTPDVIENVRGLIAEADILMMQYEIPAESIIRAADIAKEYGTKVVVNPAPFKELPRDFYGKVDVLVPNEHEADALCAIYPADEQSSRAALDAILSLGVKQAVITLGERGCVYNEGGKAVFCPALKTKAVDTTSAGDSFIGALCVSICEGKSLEESIKYATKVSSITVSRHGASDSIPYADEVK